MINIFQPDVGQDSVDLLKEVFDSKWLGRGAKAQEFENQLANFLDVDVEYLHTVASCTDAIFCVFRALQFEPGSRVIIPTNSFPAIPSAIVEAGLLPVVVDIDPRTGNIALGALKDALTDDCVAVFATDYGGIPCDLAELRAVVGDRFLMLDAAASLGTFVEGVFSGKDADFACWSFDAMKLLVCGEGGGVYFRDKELLNRFREYTYLGMSAAAKSGLDRSKDSETLWWEYDIKLPGRRSMFTDINAAIGLPQMALLDGRIEHRQRVREYYLDRFLDVEQISVLEQSKPNTQYSNYFFTLLSSSRDELAKFLKERGVYSTFRYFPIHRIDLFKQYSKPCVNGDLFSDTALNLPVHDSLSLQDAKRIADLVIEFFAV